MSPLREFVCTNDVSLFLQYGTKALDKITKAILGHIENKVPPPKGYPAGEAMFFRGMFELWLTVSMCKHRTTSPAQGRLGLISKTIMFFLYFRHETWNDGCGHLL